MINDANLFHPDLRLIILLLLNLDCLIIHPNLNIHNQINHDIQRHLIFLDILIFFFNNSIASEFGFADNSPQSILVLFSFNNSIAFGFDDKYGQYMFS